MKNKTPETEQNYLCKLASCKREVKSIEQIWKLADKNQLNLNPNYQRTKVWKDRYKTNLITSIFANYPIGNITLVEDGPGWIVLDGKQRLSSIIEFRKPTGNKILRAQYPNSNKWFSWTDLTTSTDPMVMKYLSDLEGYNVQITILPSMSLLEQSKVFEMVNHSVELGHNERLYCTKYLTKQLLEWIWNKALSDYSFSGGQHRLKRFGNLRLVHSVLYRAFGSTFDDLAVKSQSVASTKLKKSSQKIHDNLIAIGISDESPITEDVLKKIGIAGQVKSFIGVSRAFKDVFDGGTKSQWHYNVIGDVLTYFTLLDYSNIFTVSNIKENSSLLLEVCTEYAMAIAKRPEYTDCSADAKTLEDRREILELVFKNKCQQNKISLERKRQSFTEEERRMAKLRAKNKCQVPSCGANLTDDNCEIDHVLPKSKFGKGEAVAICKKCNQEKKDWTPEQLSKYHDYVEKFVPAT